MHDLTAAGKGAPGAVYRARIIQ